MCEECRLRERMRNGELEEVRVGLEREEVVVDPWEGDVWVMLHDQCGQF